MISLFFMLSNTCISPTQIQIQICHQINTLSSNIYFPSILCFSAIQYMFYISLYLAKHLPDVAVQFDRRIYLKSHQIYSYSPKYLSKCCGAIRYRIYLKSHQIYSYSPKYLSKCCGAIRYRIYEDIPASWWGSLHHCPNCIPINIIIVININIIN